MNFLKTNNIYIDKRKKGNFTPFSDMKFPF